MQLYNKLTEMCFLHCADNFHSRELSTYESNCLDKCVAKFSNVNQRIMGTYVQEQSAINERRMKEMEEQIKTAGIQATASSPSTPAPETNISVESTSSTTALTNPSQPIAT